MRRALFTLFAFVMVVAACSSDSDSESDSGSAGADTTDSGPADADHLRQYEVSAEAAEEAAELAVLLIDELGTPTDALMAVLFAIDRGYSNEQIDVAVGSGQLSAAGFVEEGGGIVEPEGEPRGLIADLPSGAEQPADAEQSLGPAPVVELAVYTQDDDSDDQRAEPPLTAEEIGQRLEEDFINTDLPGSDPIPELDRYIDTDEGRTYIVLWLILMAAADDHETFLNDVLLEVLLDREGFCKLEYVAREAAGLVTFGCEPEYVSDTDTEDAAPEATVDDGSDDDGGSAGDVDAWCEVYDEYAKAWVEAASQLTDEGLSSGGVSDSLEAEIDAELQELVDQLAEVAPADIRSINERVAEVPASEVWEDAGEFQSQLLEMDDYAAATCGVSIQGYDTGED